MAGDIGCCVLCSWSRGDAPRTLTLGSGSHAAGKRGEWRGAYLSPPTLTCHASTPTLGVRTLLSWVVKGSDGLEGRALADFQRYMYQDGVGEGGHFHGPLDRWMDVHENEVCDAQFLLKHENVRK